MPAKEKDFERSSNLKRLEWDDLYLTATAEVPRGRLRAFFVNGNVYAYEDVEEEVFDEIAAAASAGKAFHRLVRTKNYKWEKESPDADPADNHRSDDLGAGRAGR